METTENTVNNTDNKKTDPKPAAKTASKAEKAAPKAEKAAPKAEKASAPSAPTASSKFEYDFLPLPAEAAAAGRIVIDPRKLIVSKFDARAQPSPLTEDFLASIRQNGLVQDPLATYARNKVTGEEGWLMVAGRRRREACVKLNLSTITVKVEEIQSFKQYLVLAGEENLKRTGMSAWDIYHYLTNLLEAGYKQSELKDVLAVTEGYVSQYLAIGKLDERVQKHVRAAVDEPFKSHAPTCVRELKRVDDAEVQVAFAQQAIAEKLSPSALKFVIEKWLAKRDAKAAENGESKGPKTGSRAIKLPDEIVAKDIKPIPKADFAAVLNHSRVKFAKLKASEKATPEGVAYAKGVVEGLLQAAGLKELPAKIQGEE